MDIGVELHWQGWRLAACLLKEARLKQAAGKDTAQILQCSLCVCVYIYKTQVNG